VEYGYVDDVIKPSEAQDCLIHDFGMQRKGVNNPREKHSNLPP